MAGAVGTWSNVFPLIGSDSTTRVTALTSNFEGLLFHTPKVRYGSKPAIDR